MVGRRASSMLVSLKMELVKPQLVREINQLFNRLGK